MKSPKTQNDKKRILKYIKISNLIAFAGDLIPELLIKILWLVTSLLKCKVI